MQQDRNLAHARFRDICQIYSQLAISLPKCMFAQPFEKNIQHLDQFSDSDPISIFPVLNQTNACILRENREKKSEKSEKRKYRAKNDEDGEGRFEEIFYLIFREKIV